MSRAQNTSRALATLALAAIMTAAVVVAVAPQAATAQATVPVVPVATGLAAPWDVAFVDGGRAYITERDSGRVLLREADGRLREVQRFPANFAGEGGLLGLTASPTFTTDRLLYAFLTTASDNRVVRFRPGGAVATVLAGIPKNTNHDAGRIAFGPDGKLWVATGDALQPALSQDPRSLAGKILRLNADGSVPADNPRAGSPVYALGFRDPQGLAWDARARLFATEFGPDRNDEVNRVVANGNYGWPTVSGSDGPGGFIDPVVIRQPAVASWSGAAVLRGGAIPAWEGDLFVAALRGQRLYRFDLDAAGAVVATTELYTGQYGRLRHVEQAPDGSLWLLTSNCDGRGTCPSGRDDRILRLGPDEQQPQIEAKYNSVGGAGGLLGAAVGPEFPARDGRGQSYEGGRIYWSAATGAQVVRGGILAHYLAFGGPDSRLGLPTSDEVAVRDGRSSSFTGGRIYWSRATRARVVYGSILRRYLSLGGPDSSLGLPTSDEYAVAGGRRSDFIGGAILWDARTNQTTVIGT